MTIQGLINKIFKANQTQNNTVSWSGSNGLKTIQEDIVDTIKQRTFLTVPTTADLLNQGFNNAILCYVQDEAFYRWSATGTPNGTTIFPADDGGVWIQETIGQTSGTVTSVGLSMPAAFTVANSPVTTSGVIGVTGAGTASQYIKGDGTLATFPTIVSGAGTTNYVSKWSNATTLTDGLIYDNGTYTGIGTTNPLARLHIKVPANNPQRGLLCLETTNAGANPFQSFWSNNAWVGYIDVNTTYFNIQSISNGLINLNPSGGNVTVGSVTNAGFKFDVIGTFRATSTTTLTSLSGTGTRMVVTDASGVLSTQSIPSGTGNISGTLTSTYIPYASGANTISDSIIYNDVTNSRIGIGTASPSYKLDVTNSAQFSGLGGSDNPFVRFTTQSLNQTFNWVTSAFASNLSPANNLVHFIGQSGSSKNSGYFGFRYSSNNSNNNILTFGLYAVDNVLNINGAGNVGIGTTSPNAKLEVVGNTINSLSGYELQTYPAFNTGYGAIGMSSNYGLALITNTVERLFITSSGNVGIGTTSPSGKLDVFSTSDVYQNIVTSGNSTSSVLSMYNSSGVTDGAAIGYNGAMRFGTITGVNAAGFTERMRIRSNGWVGIGTIAPTRELEVNGLIVTNRTSNGDGALFFGSGGGRYFYSPDSGGYIATYTGGTEKMRITPNGDIGIGTISPNASAILDIVSTTKGVLLPRMTDTQILAIPSPDNGLMVYSITQNVIAFYDGSGWHKVTHTNL